MIRAISFDAADTLIYLPDGVGAPYAEVAGRHGIAVPAAEWERAFRQAWKSAPPPEVTPDGSSAPDDQRGWWRDLVHRAISHLGLDLVPGVEEALFSDLYTHFALPGVWAVYPEAPEVLAELTRRGIELCVISNFDKRLYPVLEHSGLARYFTRIYLSSEHGADKPHPRMFQWFLADCGLTDDPQQALHVGDHPKADWAAARAVGMKFLELDRAHGHTLRDVLALL